MGSLRQQIKKKRSKNSEEHILPLINIVFLLLIFFMIAGRLSAGDPIKLIPPKSLSDMKIEVPEVIVHIGADKTYSFNNEIMDRDNLLAEIEAFQQMHASANYRLKIDEGYAGNDLLLFLSDLKARGIEKAYILTLRDGQS